MRRAIDAGETEALETPQNVVFSFEKRMKIIADKQIPYLDDYFGRHGQLITLDSAEINAYQIQDADALLIRSVTQVNETLIQNSRLRFLGSANSGSDHLDILALSKAGIHWYTAKGSNAIAVAEYVLACMACLQQQALLSKTPRVGIVGVGCVGSMLHRYLQALGYEVLLNDPPRQQTEADFRSISLAEIAKCDLICLHVPLEASGDYPTYHLINEAFLKQCKPGVVILNASRGAVINPEAIKRFKDQFIWCLDVWEHEPMIDLELLEIASIATPHIAGHTIEAKHRATEMVYREFCHYFRLQPIPPHIVLSTAMKYCLDASNWQELVFSIYNPWKKTQELKQNIHMIQSKATTKNINMQIAGVFNQFRKEQGQRREYAFADKYIGME